MRTVLRAITLATVLLFAVSVIAADKVVVIPLGGKKPTGNVIAANVLEGKTFSNEDAINIRGTMVNNGAVIFYPGTSDMTIPKGYHNGSGNVTGDVNLVSGNIKSGVTLFNATGDPNVVNTGSGNAVKANILSGKKAWVDGSEITGNIPTQSLSSANEEVSSGYYNGTSLSTVDSDLRADNIKSGVTVFGVAGSYEGEAPISAPVPRTGQTTSYVAQDDGDIQAGVVWPGQRFTNQGDGTVIDNLTGLMWQTSLGPVDDWANAINQCSSATTGSYLDWRLPNVHEFYSVTSKGAASPALPAGHPFTNVIHGNYWTSTTLAGNSTHAWFVNLISGYIYDADKASSLNVWCVRDS